MDNTNVIDQLQNLLANLNADELLRLVQAFADVQHDNR